MDLVPRLLENVPTADLNSAYSALLAQYPQSVKGAYSIGGRTYTPPPTSEVMANMGAIQNELKRRGEATDTSGLIASEEDDQRDAGSIPFTNRPSFQQ